MKEVEATLIICSEEPGAVVADIAALTSIAGYRLVIQGSQAIHDYQVDTLDWKLHNAGLSLRVRESNGAPYLTLKGSPRLIGPGIVERLEIEAPWSEAALALVARELARQGIRGVRLLPGSQALDRAGPDPSTGSGRSVHPLDVMAGLGLKTIQHRENCRQIRNVVSACAGTGPVRAELAIDSVVYHLDSQKVRHYEIEIEAKAEGGLPALEAVMVTLSEAYPATLRKWDYGKLSIGRAIQELLDRGALAGLLDDLNGNLKPAAYEKIHRFLSGR